MKNEDAASTEEKQEAPADTAAPKKGKSKKAAAKSSAKPAKGKKDGKGKKDSKSKAKGDKAPAKEKKPAAKRDQYGFREDSKKSEAAKLYGRKNGATLAEVKEKVGSSQLNLLTELEEKGYAIEKTKVAGPGKKQVTKYKIGELGKPKPKKDKKEKKASAKPAGDAKAASKKGKGKKGKAKG